MTIFQVDWRAGDDRSDRMFFVSARNASAALAYAAESIQQHSAYAYLVKVTALGPYAGQAA